MNKFIATVIVTFIFPLLARAELYNCDGKWTNKPCVGKAGTTIAEKPLNKELSANPDLAKKKSIFHELNMKNITAKKNLNIKFSIAEIEEICLARTTSLDLCKIEAEKAERKLDEKIVIAEKLNLEKQALKAQQDQLALEKEKLAEQRENAVEVNVVTTNIIRPRHPGRLPFGNLPRDKPRFQNEAPPFVLNPNPKTPKEIRERNNHLVFGSYMEVPPILKEMQRK